jgi:hypothetical protein
MRTRKERLQAAAAMHQVVADALVQAEKAQRMAEQQIKELADVKSQLEEYW